MKTQLMTAALVITVAASTTACQKKVVATAPQPVPPAVETPVAKQDPPVRTAAAAPEPARAPQPERHDHAAEVATFADELRRLMRDAYFDYDRHSIRPDAQEILSKNAQALRDLFAKYPDVTATIEGHADERGSAEYNLALGDRRAVSAKEFLVSLGIQESRIRLLSYGKERPQCTTSNEDCWQQNRRVHFAAE
jgi:peptidoglycan-associated lipoprotein